MCLSVRERAHVCQYILDVCDSVCQLQKRDSACHLCLSMRECAHACLLLCQMMCVCDSVYVRHVFIVRQMYHGY